MPQYFAGSFYTGRKSEEQRLDRNLQSGLTKFAGRRRNFGLIWRALMRLGNFDRKFQPATTEPRCCLLSFFFPIFPPLLLPFSLLILSLSLSPFFFISSIDREKGALIKKSIDPCHETAPSRRQSFLNARDILSNFTGNIDIFSPPLCLLSTLVKFFCNATRFIPLGTKFARQARLSRRVSR